MKLPDVVTRKWIAQESLCYDTLIAAAFRRALHVKGKVRDRRVKERARHYRRRFKGTREAFRNSRGVDPDAGRW